MRARARRFSMAERLAWALALWASGSWDDPDWQDVARAVRTGLYFYN